VTGGKYGGCIRFEKYGEKVYCIEMPNAAFNNHITNQITISVWVNWANPETMPDKHNWFFSVHSESGAEYEGILGVET